MGEGRGRVGSHSRGQKTVGGLWRRLKGSREIHVRTKGFWGPSRKGSLGVVLHSVT